MAVLDQCCIICTGNGLKQPLYPREQNFYILDSFMALASLTGLVIMLLTLSFEIESVSEPGTTNLTRLVDQ